MGIALGRAPQRDSDAESKKNALWKMLDAQCTQLRDAVASARTPFLLALTWAFIWAWSLYVVNYGYVSSFYLHRLNDSLKYSKLPVANAKNNPNFKQFLFDCNRVTARSLGDEVINKALADGELKDEVESELKDKEHDPTKATYNRCIKALEDRRDW